jgi:hypothetical protein
MLINSYRLIIFAGSIYAGYSIKTHTGELRRAALREKLEAVQKEEQNN